MYKRGLENIAIDALSRLPEEEEEMLAFQPIDLPSQQQWAKMDQSTPCGARTSILGLGKSVIKSSWAWVKGILGLGWPFTLQPALLYWPNFEPT